MTQRPQSREVAATWEPIDTIRPWGKNPRRNDGEPVERVAKSIERFGFSSPIVCRAQDRRIIAGHTRWKAAQKLGLTQVPVRFLPLDEDQAAALALADNRLTEITPWDEDGLAEVLRELEAASVDLDGLGWSSDELDALLSGDTEKVMPEPSDDAPTDAPTTKRGDIWRLGSHRLICGDASDPRDVARLMGDDAADITVVDPPYQMPDSVWGKWIADPSIVFGQMRHMRMIPTAWWRFERVIVKRYRHRSATVQIDHRHAFIAQVGTNRILPGTSETFPSVIEQEAETEHDHQKPVALLLEHLSKWSPPWSVVVDPFMGSGSTLLAAEQMGRRCMGIEIDPAQCDAIVRRWEAATGLTATIEGDHDGPA